MALIFTVTMTGEGTRRNVQLLIGGDDVIEGGRGSSEEVHRCSNVLFSKPLLLLSAVPRLELSFVFFLHSH